ARALAPLEPVGGREVLRRRRVGGDVRGGEGVPGRRAVGLDGGEGHRRLLVERGQRGQRAPGGGHLARRGRQGRGRAPRQRRRTARQHGVGGGRGGGEGLARAGGTLRPDGHGHRAARLGQGEGRRAARALAQRVHRTGPGLHPGAGERVAAEVVLKAAVPLHRELVARHLGGHTGGRGGRDPHGEGV